MGVCFAAVFVVWWFLLLSSVRGLELSERNPDTAIGHDLEIAESHNYKSRNRNFRQSAHVPLTEKGPGLCKMAVHPKGVITLIVVI